MSTPRHINGFVNGEQVTDWEQLSAGTIHFNKHSRPLFSPVSATLTVFDGERQTLWTEEQVRELLIDLGHKSLLSFTSTEAYLSHIVDTAAKHGLQL